MTLVPATIAVDVMEHADGRPIAYTDATSIVVFVYQEPDGTYVIDICTRDDTARGRLLLLLDGQPLPSGADGHCERQSNRTAQPCPVGTCEAGSAARLSP